MQQGKKLLAGLLAFVMLLGAFPVQALATETEECTHQYETITVAPTCVLGGHTTYNCVHCGDTYTADETDPTGICTPELVEEESATCTKEGTAAHFACSQCEAKFWDAEATQPVADEAELVLPLAACVLKLQEEAASTCQTEGTAAHYVCGSCQKKYWDAEAAQPVADEAELVLPLAACTVDAVEEVSATCQAEGTAAYYLCGLCQKKYWDAEATQPVEKEEDLVLPLGACTLEPVEEVGATCSQTGVAAHYSCSLCQKLYKDNAGTEPVASLEELTLDTLDHTYGAWEQERAPEPKKPGSQVQICEVCQDKQTREIPALTCDLATPTLTVKLDSTTNRPALSWTAVTGATSYWIYRCEDGSSENVLLAKVTQRSYTDTKAAPGVTYRYTVMAINDTSYGNASQAKTCVAKCVKPQVIKKSDTATGKPVLSWEAVEGAVKYEVYRSTSKSSNFKLLTTTTETTATDTKASVGTKYYYKVKAICANTAGNSAYSATVNHICDCAQPVIAAESGASGGIKISWAKISGAKKYQIYRATSKDGTYTRIATTSSLSYTDTKAPKNKVSYYKVNAYGSSTSSQSANSKAVSLMNHTFGAWKTITPNMPESEGWKERTCSACGHVEGVVTPVLKRSLSTPKVSISADSATGRPSLSWGSISGASKYYIFQVDADGNRSFLAETTAKKYIHKEAKVSTKYSYQVLAVSATKCSAYSATKSIVCKCPKPGAISFTSDTVTGKPIARWEAVEGAVQYEVYRSTSSSSGFKKVATTEELTVVIASSNAGSTYYYRLKAVGKSADSASANSANTKHTCDCAQPVIAAQSGASGGIKISWAKISGAKKYQVYRATSKDGTYTRIATTSSLSYTDTKAPKNKVSYYKVNAYGSSTASLSAYSQVVSLMNHTFGAWKTIIPNMPESEGWKERTCSACGHVEGAATPVLKRSLSTPKVSISTNGTSGKPYLSWGSVKSASRYYIFLVDSNGERTYLAETTAKNFTHADAQVGKKYTYQVLAVNSTKCSAYSAAKSVICKCPKPTVKCVSDVQTGAPILSWAAVEGAVKYEVYRSTSSSSGFKLVTTTQETEVLVSGGKAGTTYYYRVKAVGAAAGTESANSSNVKHVCDCAQPVIAAESGASGGIKITWEKVTGAKKYQVYRATSANGTYSRIATTTSLSYTDTKAPKNKVSYYKVNAYASSTSSLSAYSQVVSMMNHTYGSWKTVAKATPEATGLKERVCSGCGDTQQQVIPKLTCNLATPVLSVTAQVGSGKPTLSWKAVSKANGYRVYQLDPATGGKIFLTQVDGTTYVHKDAVPGNQYTFCIAAVNDTGCSDYSQQKTALCKLAVPTLQIKQDKTSGALTLSWTAVEGAVGYDVYRSSMSSGGFELYESTQALTVAVTDATPGVPQYFKIQAIHGQDMGADSIMSGAVSMDGSSTDLVIHAGWINDSCNKIVWNRVKNATSYQVYRATSFNGTYSKIVTVKGSEHVDLNVQAGVTYYYQVKAYNKDNKLLITSESDAADKKCAVPIKIYVSPSSQPENKYAYGNTNEQAECRKIALALVDALERCGFTAMTNVNNGDDMYVRMPESNAWGANLHVPIHSNAFNRSAMGTQVYHDGVSGSVSRKAASAIYKQLAPLSPGTSGESIKKHSGLYEFNKSNNPTAYIEVAFHDTKKEAQWIVNNTQKIAEAICLGICNTYGFTYIAP